jgi:hypothetical protein
MLGQAHSSPMVRGATVWKLFMKRTSLARSRRLSLCRMISTAIAYTRVVPASSRRASLGSSL